MSEPRRQHPVAAITQVMQIFRQNIFTIIVVLFLGSGGEGTFFEFIGIIPVVAFLLVAGVLEWWRFTYQVVDGDLHIERGVIVRKKLYLSPERIQVIDISAGIIQRIFGLVSVEVKTAGSSSKDAKIDAVTRDEAERIKEILPKRTATVHTEEESEESPEPQVYTLTMKDLVTSASTSGNLTVTLALVAGAVSQLDQFITQERIEALVKTTMPSTIETNIAVSLIILALVVSWALSFLGTFIRYYNFTLTVYDDELHVEQGLFTQKQSTVPFNRIQGVRIKEELLREPFGYAAIFLESAGYGEQESNITTLFPLLHRSDISSFLDEVIPEYNVKPETVRPPQKSLRRYILRLVWAALFVIIPLLIWVPYGIFSLFLLLPAIGLGYAQYRDALIGTAGKTIIIRRRKLSKTTAIVKKRRIQAAVMKQNPFQKRLALYSYQVTIAAGDRGRTFKIRELDEAADYNFLKWVSPVYQKPDQSALNNN